MKNIKDITLSIFAIIGFIAILSSFNNQPQQETHGTPESHVWEFHMPTEVMINSTNTAPSFAINKVTGEVRKYSASTLSFNKDERIEDYSDDKYTVMKLVE